MTNTNQLIEELREKMLLDFDQRPETQRAIALDFLRKAISQTEQECDKKWGERIETEKDILTKVLSKAKHERNRLIYEEKIETLDDLLNNK